MQFDKFDEQDKGIFEKLFTLPHNYELCNVIATTFTLSKRMIAELLISCNAAANNIKLTAMSDVQKRLALKSFGDGSAAVKIYADRIVENVSSYSLSGVDKAVNHLQEKYVTLINDTDKTLFPDGNGYFHPKILLVKFKSKTDGASERYRVSVSSKNLTYDSYFQAGVVLEGEVGEKEQNGADLYNFLSVFADVKEWNNLKNTAFTYNGEPAEFLFTVPDSINNSANSFYANIRQAVGKDLKKLLIFTDSLSIGQFDDFNYCANTVMVSNPKSWAQHLFNGKTSDYFKECTKNRAFKVLKPNAKYAPPYIHSKVYALQKEKNTVVYVGSANCTSQAMKRNYEAMVRLEYDSPFDLEKLERANGKGEHFEFADIKWKDIENARKEIELENLACAIKFTAPAKGYSDEMLTLHYDISAIPEQFKSCEYFFCPPNTGLKFNLAEHNGTISYPCSYYELPLNGKAKLLAKIGFESFYFDADVDLSNIRSDINDIKNNPQSRSDNAYDNLFRGCRHYDVRDTVPPVPSSAYNDSFDIRMAKYIRHCSYKPSWEIISRNADDLLKRCARLKAESNLRDLEASEKEEEGFDITRYENELERFCSDLERLQRIASEMTGLYPKAGEPNGK